MLDVILAIFQGLLGAAAAWVGLKLTITPLKKSDGTSRKRYTTFFRIAIPVSVLLGVVQAYRSYQASEEVSRHLTTIEKATRTSRHTFAQIYNPMPVTNDPYLPFQTGETPNVAIQMFNAGDYPIKAGFFTQELILLPAQNLEDDKVQDDAFKQFEAHTPMVPIGAVAPHSQEGRYNTVTTSSALTADQVSQLNDNSLRLCALAKVAWEDETGQYCTTSFQCLQKDTGKNLVAFDWRGVGHKYNTESVCTFKIIEPN
ncbi:MAG TPA: hypothetical protein VGF06_17465 [Terriglobales bacterium]|jgi:hypothetical protein